MLILGVVPTPKPTRQGTDPHLMYNRDDTSNPCFGDANYFYRKVYRKPSNILLPRSSVPEYPDVRN